jgi:hypothetical protein
MDELVRSNKLQFEKSNYFIQIYKEPFDCAQGDIKPQLVHVCDEYPLRSRLASILCLLHFISNNKNGLYRLIVKS